jgi:hypothetical protein
MGCWFSAGGAVDLASRIADREITGDRVRPFPLRVRVRVGTSAKGIPTLINRRFHRDGATSRGGDVHGLNFDSINPLGMSGSRIAVHQKPTVFAAETGLPIQVARMRVRSVGSDGIITNRGPQNIVTSIFADIQIMLPQRDMIALCPLSVCRQIIGRDETVSRSVWLDAE